MWVLKSLVCHPKGESLVSPNWTPALEWVSRGKSELLCTSVFSSTKWLQGNIEKGFFLSLHHKGITSARMIMTRCIYVCMCLSIHVYVCMHSCVCVLVSIYIYTCVCIYMFVPKYICACVCLYICICLCVCVYIYTYVHMCIHMSLCIFMCLCVSVCICIYECMYVEARVGLGIFFYHSTLLS